MPPTLLEESFKRCDDVADALTAMQPNELAIIIAAAVERWEHKCGKTLTLVMLANLIKAVNES